MARPKEALRKYADQQGLSKRQIRRMGGIERVQAMSEDARKVLANMASRKVA